MYEGDGWAALELDMPGRVPRTEYSAEMHYELIRAVTGIDVAPESDDEVKAAAARRFQLAWHYDFYWSTLIDRDEFGDTFTNMGHAVYEAAGADYDSEVRSLFHDPEEVFAFEPEEAFGTQPLDVLTRRFEEDFRRNYAAHPEGVSMTGVYVTLVSGLIHVLGWDMLLLSAGLDPQRFAALVDRYARWMGRYFEALAAADVPVVMVHDDIVWTSGPFMAPEWYRKHIFGHYRKFFEPIIDSGKKIIFTSDGDYTEFLDDLVECGVHGFVMEPATDMRGFAEKYGRTHVFIGNADTRVLLSGDRARIRAEVERCMDIGKECPGYFLAVGNHIPPNTPVDAALYYNSVYEELCHR